MIDFLRHPLFLTAIGAALARIIAPALLRRWQVHQKELEIKIALVSEISESVAAFVAILQIVHSGATEFADNPQQLSNLQQDLIKAYREWEVKSSVIGVKLQTYLRDTKVPHEWAQLGRLVEDFYALEGLSKDAIHSLAAGLSKKLAHDLKSEDIGHEWDKIKAAVLRKKTQIINDILGAPKLNLGVETLCERLTKLFRRKQLM